ncbi:MAG TPA: YkvA family protein [Pyrinomonadaceae bacterium]|nr:YkvA family protein [Pyrinomonadaceae bacterium]
MTKNEGQNIKKREAKGRMKNLLMFLPNMFTLLGRLIKDSRVPIAEKTLFAAAIVYVIMPLDFIPDVIPFIGQIDDLYLVALTLLRLINKTDETVIREHWKGGGDIVGLANSAASLAPLLLPKRVSRVLSSKVELAPNVDSITDITKNKKPVLIETAPEGENEPVKISSPA